MPHQERTHDYVACPRSLPHRNSCRGLAFRVRDHTGRRRGFEHAVGATVATDPAVYRGPSGQDHGGDHHYCHRADARIRRYFRRIPPPCSDRVRPLDRVCSELVLPVVLLFWRRSAGLMSEMLLHDQVPGFEAPVHRALTEPILLGGAPRVVAIANGTLAAAVGLGLRLWIAGLLLWAIGHMAAVWAAKRDAQFVDVVRRHLRYPTHLGV